MPPAFRSRERCRREAQRCPTLGLSQNRCPGLCRRTHPFPLEHRNARRWFVNRIAGSQLFHLLIQCLGHGIDAFLPRRRFRRFQKRFCRLTVLAIFENVGKFGVAAAVRASSAKPTLMSWFPSRFSLEGERPSAPSSSPVVRDLNFVPLPITEERLLLTFFSTTSPPPAGRYPPRCQSCCRAWISLEGNPPAFSCRT